MKLFAGIYHAAEGDNALSSGHQPIIYQLLAPLQQAEHPWLGGGHRCQQEADVQSTAVRQGWGKGEE